MGCIYPKNNSEIAAEYSNTVDFKDFFDIQKNMKMSSSQTVYLQMTEDKSKPKSKGRGTESMIDVSSTVAGDKHQAKVLTLEIFNMTDNIDEEKCDNNFNYDTITITQNHMLSNQGSISKEKGIFSFGKQAENQATNRVDYDFPDDAYMLSRQFAISYNDLHNKYYIEEGEQSTGVFMKIEECFTLKNGLIFNYSNKNTMKCIIDKDNQDHCVIEFLNGEFKGRSLSFSASDYKYVRLGRSPSNEIISQTDTVSRIQWTIIYIKQKWVIYDGGFDLNNIYKPSSNGLWLLIVGKNEITNGAIWKTGERKFISKID